jgi:type I restriction enzyme S subunit
MSKFPQGNIGDLLTLQRGFDITKKEQTDGAYPVVSSGGVSSYHNEFMVKGPGVVIGRKGTLGTAFYLQSDYWPHDTSLWVKDFKGNDPKYVYYFLKALPLERLDSGSANPTLNRNVVHQVNTLKPPLKDQAYIAQTLTLLDNKIELNNSLNAELESMAKTLYDYWFVQFDFPIFHEQAKAMGKPELAGKHYKSSGGKMVYNETLKREIPEGWGVEELGIKLNTSLGGTPSTKEANYWDDGDIPWLNSGEVVNFPVTTSEESITQDGINDSAAELLPKGSIVLSIVRHIRASILAIDAAFNQSVVGVYESPELKSSYIYPYLSREIPRLMSLRTGAQQPHINKSVVDSSLMIIPDSATLKEYYLKTDSIFKKIMVTAFENQQLVRLRDWLLPMLMNGQITVK